jgi:DNA invertase Pin-like site-specific DNA recombinase
MAAQTNQYVAYYRVSTHAQSQSGLGLDAQRNAVDSFIAANHGSLIAAYTEVESGRAKNRPQLKAAIDDCSRRSAILVIARLDRLARNLFVVASLMESRVEFVAADMPSASKLTIQLIAAIAEHERDQISRNTRNALHAAKVRGTRLGNPEIAIARKLAVEVSRKKAALFAKETVDFIRGKGIQSLPLTAIASRLNRDGVRTQRNKTWTPSGVRNVLRRATQISANLTRTERD